MSDMKRLIQIRDRSQCRKERETADICREASQPMTSTDGQLTFWRYLPELQDSIVRFIECQSGKRTLLCSVFSYHLENIGEAMSLWIRHRNKSGRHLWLIDTHPVLLLFVIAALMIAAVRYAELFAKTTLVIMGSGLICLTVAKVSLFRRGIWIS